MSSRIAFQTHGFAIVVCRNLRNGKFLAVKESRGRGWWLPAGHVDAGQNFVDAAIRETVEEAGVDVDIKGVLGVEHTLSDVDQARLRVIFYAEPKDPSAAPKSVPDEESDGAEWKSVEEIAELDAIPPPQGLRGGELLRWARYIQNGGLIAPIFVSSGMRGTLYDGFFRMEDQGPKSVWSAVQPSSAAPAAVVAPSPSAEGIDAPQGPKLWTALHHAVNEQDEGLVRQLLLRGASAAAVTHKGRTPLHFAVSRGNERLVRLLLLSGSANVAAVDVEGDTAQDIAQTLPPELQRPILRLLQLVA